MLDYPGYNPFISPGTFQSYPYMSIIFNKMLCRRWWNIINGLVRWNYHQLYLIFSYTVYHLWDVSFNHISIESQNHKYHSKQSMISNMIMVDMFHPCSILIPKIRNILVISYSDHIYQWFWSYPLVN